MAKLSNEAFQDPIRNLAIIAIASAFVGGALVVVGILDNAPEMYMLGAFVAGIPLAFYVYMWWTDLIGPGVLAALGSEGRRRRREDHDERWMIYADAPPPSPPPVPGTRGPSQAMPLYGPGTCPSCGGALFYGRLNCPHCSEPVFRDEEGMRPPEL